MNSRPIRVLIVDDSALVRKALTDSLAQDPAIEVVGTAMDPYVARDKILSLSPDVMTLDIEMPRMDGITFLKLLMKHRPMPVVVMSSLTQTGSAKALEALQAGAVDVIAKPSSSFSITQDGARLSQIIKAAAQARFPQPAPAHPTPPPVRPPHAGVSTAVIPDRRPVVTGPANPRRFSPRQLILMGASTGGTEALKEVITTLSPDLPGICIVQHIPAHFSTAFANRLNEISRLRVREARPDDRVEPGLVLIAPGGHHLVLRWVGAGYTVQIADGPLVHYQRPSVDVMFDSAVKCGAGPHSLALLLTGMGCDGAAGLLSLRQVGAQTIAQDESSCVVFGMPREAIRLNAAQKVLPLRQMASHIEHFANAMALNSRPAPVAATSVASR
jgi:two-component system, chemotaxis family, protein-glutamate methylesterase/glutaminase